MLELSNCAPQATFLLVWRSHHSTGLWSGNRRTSFNQQPALSGALGPEDECTSWIGIEGPRSSARMPLDAAILSAVGAPGEGAARPIHRNEQLTIACLGPKVQRGPLPSSCHGTLDWRQEPLKNSLVCSPASSYVAGRSTAILIDMAVSWMTPSCQRRG
jgi:hypothetical protein